MTLTPLGRSTTQNITASDGAIAYFSDFAIASGHHVNCVQPSANISSFFIVFSGDDTQLPGQFDSTGNIYLIYSVDIIFGWRFLLLSSKVFLRV